MALVGVDTKAGVFYRQGLGPGEALTQVLLPELARQDQEYNCVIRPVGDKVYVLNVWIYGKEETKKKGITYPYGTPSCQVFIVHPGRSWRLSRWHVRNNALLTDQVAMLEDQHPSRPEIILVAWQNLNKEDKRRPSILQVWSTYPDVRLQDEWVVDHRIARATFPEAWPVAREDILVTAVGDEPVPAPVEITVPLSAVARQTGRWYVTPYGRFRASPDGKNIEDYGFGTVLLRKYRPPTGFSIQPYLRFEERKGDTYIHDLRTGRCSATAIPAVFRLRAQGGSLDSRIIDTLDLEWFPERFLLPVLVVALRSRDVATYVLQAYQPSALDL